MPTFLFQFLIFLNSLIVLLIFILDDDVGLYVLDDFLPVDDDIKIGLIGQFLEFEEHVIVALL